MLILLGMLAVCGPLSVDMYLPALPSIATAFSIDDAAAQLTLTGFILGFSVGMLLYGPLSDAYGRRPILLLGVGLYVIASVACALAFSVGGLIAMRFVQALGAGAAAVLARAIVRDTAGVAEAAKTLSTMAMMAACGPLIAPLIGGQLLLVGGWRMVFVLLTALGSVLLISVIYSIPESLQIERRAPGALLKSFAAYSSLLCDPLAIGYILCGGAAFAAMYAAMTATPFVYINYFGSSAQQYGLLFSFNIVGVICGNFLNTRYVEKLGTFRLTVAASATVCVAALGILISCAANVGGLPVIVAGLFVVFGANGVLGANCSTELMLRYPKNAGAAAALFGSIKYALGALASVAVGLTNSGTPREMAIVIAGCALICFIGRCMIVRLNEKNLHLIADAQDGASK